MKTKKKTDEYKRIMSSYDDDTLKLIKKAVKDIAITIEMIDKYRGDKNLQKALFRCGAWTAVSSISDLEEVSLTVWRDEIFEILSCHNIDANYIAGYRYGRLINDEIYYRVTKKGYNSTVGLNKVIDNRSNFLYSKRFENRVNKDYQRYRDEKIKSIIK
jgi:hypothetical protein